MEIKKLLVLFNKREKKKLLVLFVMMIFAAIFETIGIGLIVPFVGIVTNPKIIQEQDILLYFYSLLKFETPMAFMIFSVAMLLLIFIFKNIYLLLFQYAQSRVILNQQVKLSRKLFKEYLIKPYSFHLQSNTATLLRNVDREVPKVFNGIIMAGFHLLTEVLVITFILILLIYTAPLATMIATGLLSMSVFAFFKFFRKKISELGKEQRELSSELIKWVNQGLGASKEVKVSGKERFFVDSYAKQSQIMANNSVYMRMLEFVPRLFIETLVVSIVLITMLIIIIQENNTTTLVSTMALFAMAAFRIMPSINRVVGLITSIKYNKPALDVVYEDLFMNHEIELQNSSYPTSINQEGKLFNNEIYVNDISFRYPNQKKYALRNISLKIPIGHSIAFIGESGAGKTTLVDIILGLFQPEKGSVMVDGKNLFDIKSQWQQKIGYIPQTIYLSDDTIRSNVAFGLKSYQINDEEVWRALEQAQLKEFIESLPDKLETKVGERGVRLSGGQRQRIGIARALYHDPEILFMDEATSALDNNTENEIMKAIEGLKGEKTLIIIAHRLSTIENCDIVFSINNGRLLSIEKNFKQSVM